jgi:hypothetical protein
MPFYFKKSVSAGPFRFNFSQGGVGMSVGVRGLRIGTGPRGHYVQAGRDGFYYRQSLGRPGGPAPIRLASPRIPATSSGGLPVDMIEVTSGDVLAMSDAAFGDVLNEINAKHRQPRMAMVLAGFAAAIAVLCMFVAGAAAAPALLIMLPAWAAGAWFDSYRRTAVLFYDIEADSGAYTDAVVAFDQLAACAGRWHVEAGGAVRDITTWKRNAGASHLVRRKPTMLGYGLPAVLKTNVTPPVLHAGKRKFYFLPDVLLIEDGTGFGAVGYKDLRVAWQHSNFIEEGAVPHDAEVIKHNWQHPNKSGGPDRRFKSNRQLPVCRYEAVHLQSANGVNELFEFSRIGMAGPFATALEAMPTNQGLGVLRAIAAS